MNFLSHFYIHQSEPNPMYHAGLILPDLTRGFAKHPGKLPDDQYLSYRDFARGCRQHYEADKIFHASAFFEWGTHVCTEKIKQAQFDTQVERRWFIGHVMFELLLDRLLVRHQPKVAVDFYQELNQVDENLLHGFISLHEPVTHADFLRFYSHFRKAAYIKNYSDNNLFAFSLSRIMIRAGLPAISMVDKLVLSECVRALENEEFKNVQSVLFELKNVFK